MCLPLSSLSLIYQCPYPLFRSHHISMLTDFKVDPTPRTSIDAQSNKPSLLSLLELARFIYIYFIFTSKLYTYIYIYKRMYISISHYEYEFVMFCCVGCWPLEMATCPGQEEAWRAMQDSQDSERLVLAAFFAFEAGHFGIER